MLTSSPNLTMLVLRHWSDYADPTEFPPEVPEEEMIDLPVFTSLEIQSIPKKVTMWLLPRINSPDFRSLAVDEPVTWDMVTFNPPNKFSHLILRSISKAPKVVLIRGTGGKTLKFAVTPTLAMSRDWLDQKVDPPGVDLQIQTDGSPATWWENLGKALGPALTTTESVTLSLEAETFTTVDSEEKQTFVEEMECDFISNHFSFITSLAFKQQYDAGRLLRYLGSPRPDGSWPCPKLTSIDCRHLYSIRLIVRDILKFSEARLQAAKNEVEGARPERLKALYLEEDVVEIFRGMDYLRDLECSTAAPS